LIPAPVKNSTKEVLNLVCPVLKSFPIKMPLVSLISFNPSTKVFWGEPLMKMQSSFRAAKAKIVDGAI
jgi:hypothetical protein